MKLWLCLRFERLPLESLDRAGTGLVVVLERQRVLCANDRAAELGIRPGMGVATVRALAAEEPCQLLERDREAEARTLQRLCCWAYGVTPTLFSYREDCLQLEVGGCLALFRGLDPLLREVASGLTGRGFEARMGLAPTPAAAWLLSHADSGAALDCGAALEERLAPLPLALLADFSDTVDALRRAGLHCFGDILALPPTALARRCGAAFRDFLQRALGRHEEPSADFQPPPTFSDEYWFGYEVRANEELYPALQMLLQSLCGFLRNTQLQTGEIHWQLVGMDHSLREVTVRSSSRHSDWQNWYQLTRVRFERLALASSVEGVALACRELVSGELENIDLFAPRKQREPLAGLLDRLRNRLGLQAVLAIGCRDEHLPELALYTGYDRPAGSPAGAVAGEAQRPFWLMPEPQPLGERNGQLRWQGRLDLVYGPERIEDNWWREPACRDYYIARGQAGQYYWVFRDRRARRWFIHGIFA
ncbi:DNA polymerase Y family protein [Mangrovimicrobium sediminis]|uniref:DNA polymerase Y family protein n=1 Tax=Mangrovimicrobium sediminis TaxID=2562682 RepID=A0A4Z0M3V5_9GAMM|nr:DNA polymerase Y family protein [Haliea sp. SAOS-164]TGD74302.1 DNA polymerase Y family protein [Haliea sp. SAOS-164]